MGKPTGFMEYKREVSAAQDPKKRIRHFNEFHEHIWCTAGTGSRLIIV